MRVSGKQNLLFHLGLISLNGYALERTTNLLGKTGNHILSSLLKCFPWVLPVFQNKSENVTEQFKQEAVTVTTKDEA